MKIAIIGSGISGLTAAYVLHRDFDITVFEANNYVGGHTHTIDVKRGDRSYAVDTGFIVFNEVTYPNFCKMIRRLGVSWQPTRMTFSVKCERTRLEYSPHNLNAFFAQRRNAFKPSFWRMIYEIERFRRSFDTLLSTEHDEIPLVTYLRNAGYSERFINHFIVPMGASLWSADPKVFEQFPLGTFVRFFKNHGIFEVQHPLQWYVIKGGSARYVEKLIAPFADRIRTRMPVRKVSRKQGSVEVVCSDGSSHQFDQVIIAAHSDQALSMLDQPTEAEREILGALPYQENTVILHTDRAVLPSRKWIWASWNYLIPRAAMQRVAVTYNMNILQTIDSPLDFCVTLNKTDSIAENAVIGRYLYSHPIYKTGSPGLQQRHDEISGKNRVHFCGAYWSYGFHEDGVRSALKVCKYFGKGL
ncbi:MAG: NAD(P)/FAD-dependent oxidoreductase [Nitrospirota bacterium]